MEEQAAMNRRHALIAYILIACTLVLALIARAAETRTGSWTIAHSDLPGKVEGYTKSDPPASINARNAASNLLISSKCKPVVGSSKM